MPELPEVETIRGDLEEKVVGATICSVDFIWDGILKDIDTRTFEKIISGKRITQAGRRAKNLYLSLEGGINILMHMKMTGHLIVTDSAWKIDRSGRWQKQGEVKSPLLDPLNQYIRAVFYLSDNRMIAFSDLRKFAYVRLLSDEDLQNEFQKYGPEPLTPDFNVRNFISKSQGKKVAIKKFLMDPKNVAGIGNIYADEILWESKIHPLRPVNTLSEMEVSAIIKNTKKILKESIRLRGTSTSDFRDAAGKKGAFGDRLKVYQRTDKPCLRDGTPIKRIVVGGRGTHYCSKCQEEVK